MSKLYNDMKSAPKDKEIIVHVVQGNGAHKAHGSYLARFVDGAWMSPHDPQPFSQSEIVGWTEDYKTDE